MSNSTIRPTLRDDAAARADAARNYMHIAGLAAQHAEEFRMMFGRKGEPPVDPATKALARHFMRKEMQRVVVNVKRALYVAPAD